MMHRAALQSMKNVADAAHGRGAALRTMELKFAAAPGFVPMQCCSKYLLAVDEKLCKAITVGNLVCNCYTP